MTSKPAWNDTEVIGALSDGAPTDEAMALAAAQLKGASKNPDKNQY